MMINNIHIWINYNIFKFLTNSHKHLVTWQILFSERAQVSNSSDDAGIIDTSLGSVCNNTEAATLNPLYVYILMSFFVLLDMLAIVVSLTLMDILEQTLDFIHLEKLLKST